MIDAALLGWLILNPLIGAQIGLERGRAIDGALLSLLLGPVGWFTVMGLSDLKNRDD